MGGTLRFSLVPSITFLSAISGCILPYNNDQTFSPLLQSFIMANLQICNISAAEVRSTNDPCQSNATVGPTTDNIVGKLILKCDGNVCLEIKATVD